MKKLVIIGAGGHGRVVADIAQKLNRYKQIVFLDDGEEKESMGFPIVGKTCFIAFSETISGCAGRYPDLRSGRYLASQDDILAARGQEKPRHRIGARAFLYLLRNA